MAANEATANSWHSFHAMNGPILLNNLSLKVENVTAVSLDAFLTKTTTNLGPVDVDPQELELLESLSTRIETSTWSYIGEFSSQITALASNDNIAGNGRA